MTRSRWSPSTAAMRATARAERALAAKYWKNADPGLLKNVGRVLSDPAE